MLKSKFDKFQNLKIKAAASFLVQFSKTKSVLFLMTNLY